MKWRFGFENFAPIDEVPENAPEGVRRAIREYKEVAATDLGAILEADRIQRRADRAAQERRLEEEQAALHRVRQDRAKLSEEADLRRTRIAAEKRALQNEIEALDRDIAKIKAQAQEKTPS